MQFPVPQFLDVEDKIFGPFSLKQFGFVFAGGLLDVALFRIFKFNIVFFATALPITLIAGYFTFGMFNGKHVYDQIPALLRFFTSPKVLVFHKSSDVGNLDVHTLTLDEYKQITVNPAEQATTDESPQSKLKRLSRMLDQKTEEETEIIGRK